MREILFRGKRKDNGKWVEGHYGEYYSGKENVSCISIPKETISGSLCYDVIPETVGQYTGLCDKNGTKIFESDIVKMSYKGDVLTAVVRFGNYNQPDKILKTHLGFYFDFDTVNFEDFRKDVGYWTGRTFGEIEVIGNVHDGGATAE